MPSAESPLQILKWWRVERIFTPYENIAPEKWLEDNPFLLELGLKLKGYTPEN